MRATFKLRVGRVRLYVWPRSFPWLLEIGRRSWWLFDRGQNRAPDSAKNPEQPRPEHGEQHP